MNTSHVFIDSSVADIPVLLKGLPGETRCHVLGPGGALARIADALGPVRGLEQLVIVAHGEPGRFWLGGEAIDAQSLTAQAALLETIGLALAPDAEVHLYACQAAASEAGAALLRALAHWTGAKVAAHTGVIGAGDADSWLPDVSIGEIRRACAFAAESRAQYQAKLAVNDFTPFAGGDATAFFGPALLGDGTAVTINSITYTGVNSAASLFSDGISFGSISGVDFTLGRGVLLTSGDGTPPLMNTSTGFSTNNGAPGDADLTALAGLTTFNASVLEISFRTPSSATGVSFDFFFGSEEFPEFINSFPDIGAVIVDGVNFAFFNGDPAQLLNINTASVVNFFATGTGMHPMQAGAGPLTIEYDGISGPLKLVAPLGLGVVNGDGTTTHTLKIGVADSNDSILDSALFISNFQIADGSGGGGIGGGGAGTDPVSSNATCAGFPGLAMITGDAGNNVLKGTAGAECIEGLAGNDVLNGYAGNDVLLGGLGNDNLNAYDGHDTVGGGQGDDTLRGYAGNDLMAGNEGMDILFGDSGNDTMSGGANNDRLDGSSGNDSLDGSSGNDSLVGGSGADSLTGGAGQDTLLGGVDNDRLKGEQGDDLLTGGSGNDTLEGNSGLDVFSFLRSEGRDLILDFDAGVDSDDVIRLLGFGTALDSFAEVQAASTNVGGDAVISLGTGRLTLQDVLVEDLAAENFAFA